MLLSEVGIGFALLIRRARLICRLAEFVKGLANVFSHFLKGLGVAAFEFVFKGLRGVANILNQCLVNFALEILAGLFRLINRVLGVVLSVGGFALLFILCLVRLSLFNHAVNIVLAHAA